MTTFPNVPNVPGVPAVGRLPSSFAAAQAGIVLMIADQVGLLDFLSPVWGLYQNNVRVIAADNVATLDYKRDWSLPNYRIEQGGFETYNKVQMPFEVRLRFTAGGSIDNRQQMLDSIEQVAGTLQLFDVITPEKVYHNVNIMHEDMRREHDRGNGLLAVDIWCMEIRQDAVASFSNTQAPSGASTQDTGTVQTQTPSITQAGAPIQ